MIKAPCFETRATLIMSGGWKGNAKILRTTLSFDRWDWLLV